VLAVVKIKDILDIKKKVPFLKAAGIEQVLTRQLKSPLDSDEYQIDYFNCMSILPLK
jgi:hypothetical protein